MFEALIDILNRTAAMITASLVNTSLVTLAAVAIAFLAARGKGWSAATRYGLWLLILGFVIAAPFVWGLFTGEQPAPPEHSSIRPVHLAMSATVQETSPPTAVVQSPIRPSLAAIILLCWMVAASAQAVRVLRGFLHGLRLKRSSAAPDRDLACAFERLHRRPDKLLR